MRYALDVDGVRCGSGRIGLLMLASFMCSPPCYDTKADICIVSGAMWSISL